jgi:hypothetical protein
VELDPAQLNAVVTIARVVLLISARAGLFEKAQHERERERILSEMTRREFGDDASNWYGENRAWQGAGRENGVLCRKTRLVF